MRCKAVVLAAGMGARLAPLTPAIPKEMLPVCGFPAIHHVVFEMAEMGVKEVLVILSEGKEAIREYFTVSTSAKGDTAVRLAARRVELLSRIRVSFAYQKERLGTGAAVLLAKDFAGEEDLLVAYPDDLLLLDGAMPRGCPPKALLSDNGRSSVLVRVVPADEARHYGVIFPEREGGVMRVCKILEKPKSIPFDKAYALVGRMRLTKDCVAEIARHPLTDVAGITTALDAMASRSLLDATVAPSPVYDVGTHEGYLETIRLTAEICQ